MKRELQAILDDLNSERIDLATAMRRTYPYAKELENDELACWIRQELTGYEKDDPLPEYRNVKIMVSLVYSGMNGNVQIKNGHLDSNWLDPRIVESLSIQEIREGIAHVVDLAKGPDNITQDLSVLIGMVGKNTDGGIFCNSLYQQLPRTIFIRISETVQQGLIDGLIGLLSMPVVKNQSIVPQAKC